LRTASIEVLRTIERESRLAVQRALAAHDATSVPTINEPAARDAHEAQRDA
jgi:hypothetical protein